ncbi:alcohol dehydrogenase, partial [Parabacteroides sp. OttesenSCG-928-G21]|nr:alcohol dehydrogenase [Parabacteroides sp. OttesenSCG-928-G21]
VSLTGKYIIGVNPDNGNIEWTFDEWGQNAVARGWEKISPNAAIYKDGRIFVSNGYDIGAVMLTLNNDLTSVSVAWRNDDLDTHHGSYVLVDGTIYGSNWLNNNSGNWLAVDWNTGTTKYNEAWDSNGKGSIIYADGMLYAYDERRGTVGLVKPASDKWDVVSSFRITKGEGPHWAHPVLNNGVLYIRHGNALMAYKVK